MSSQMFDNASENNENEHDDNEDEAQVAPPSQPSTEHGTQRRPRKQCRKPPY